MSKLSKEQVLVLVRSLKRVIEKVKKSDIQIFNLNSTSDCVIGKLYSSGGFRGNFDSAFESLFEYTPNLTERSIHLSKLSNLQKLVNMLFVHSFETNVVTKKEWLKAAKKVYKHLEKKLHDRSKK